MSKRPDKKEPGRFRTRVGGQKITMKKYIALLLLAGLMITAQSCGSQPEEETETDAPETEAVETIPEETEPETEYERPEDEPYIEFSDCTLSSDPVYDKDAGLLVLNFNEDDVWYDADSKCYIGLISEDAATSFMGSIDLDAYPEFKVDDYSYNGVAIKPEEELPAGEYTVSVTFGSNICTFDMTID